MLMVLAEGFYFLTIESDSCVPILGSCLWMSMSSGVLFPAAYDHTRMGFLYRSKAEIQKQYPSAQSYQSKAKFLRVVSTSSSV